MATVVSDLPDYPFFLQARDNEDPLYYDAEDFGRFIGAIWHQDGILPSTTALSLLAADVVGWRIKVNTGQAVLGNCRYLLHNPAPVTIEVPFATAPPATRTHKVWACVYDGQVMGNAYKQSIVITEDTGTGAPEPADAAASLLLGTFTISAGQSNIQATHITNQQKHASASYQLGSFQNLIGADFSQSSAFNAGTFGWYYADNVVRLQGAVSRNSGPFQLGTSYLIATMHPSLAPAKDRWLVIATSHTPYVAKLKINPNGVLQVYTPSTGTPSDYFYFDGVTYNLDG